MKEITELNTILDIVRWTVSRFNEAGLFFGHGTETAWDEAIALVFHTLHLPHDTNPIIFQAQLTTSEKEKLYQLIQRRINERIPLAYLTNEAWFANLSFYVDERVLVPRSPIAELIEKQFTPWVEPRTIHNILDIGTGSGCIAIACADAFPEAEIDACDISQEALAVAKINVLRHELQDQVKLYHSDLFEGLPVKKYDLIISNPPYVSQSELETLPKEYTHEPRKGLAGGQTGLDIVTRILKEAPRYLQPNGILIVEVGNSETALIEQFPNVPFTWLDFEKGGGGVFLLTASELKEFK